MPTVFAPPSRFHRLRALFTARTWIVMMVAFVMGLLLFTLIWTKQRTQNAFFRVDDPQRSASGRELAPLPGPDTGRIATQTAQTPLLDGAPASATVPLPQAADDDAPVFDNRMPRSSADRAPLETFGPQPALSTRDGASAPGASGSASDTAPVPVSSPAPRYPPAALRRGEAGEVVLRVHVGVDGLPKQIDLVSGSGSGRLDRAATDAMRGWRFRPALRSGQPVEGTVQVPIRFSPSR